MRALGGRRAGHWFLVGLALSLLSTGCLPELGPQRVEMPRYFRPELPELHGASASRAAVSAARTEGMTLRLLRVRASESLGERVAWRSSDVEVGFYQMLRWADPPAVLVQQALERELYERRGFRPWVSGPAPTLAVAVLAFEEVTARAHEGRVELAVVLTDPGRGALADCVVEARRPIADHEAASLARAVGAALADAVWQVADRVGEALRTEPAAAPTGRSGGHRAR